MNIDLQKIHRLQLDMLKEVKRICEKHGIPYFLMGGTLLGAVRHGGFIPWDDDLDVGMCRDDYFRFLEVADQELQSQYFIQDWKKEKHYGFPYAKMMVKNTVWLEAVSRNVDISHGVYIDIVGFYPIPDDENARKRVYKKHLLLRQMILARDGYEALSYKKGLKKALFMGTVLCSKCFRTEYLKGKYEQLLTSLPETGFSSYFPFGVPYSYKRGITKREWVEDLIPMKFEDDEFMVPRLYDEYLTYAYGDYMTPPPEDKRMNYHGIVKIDLGKYESND